MLSIWYTSAFYVDNISFALVDYGKAARFQPSKTVVNINC